MSDAITMTDYINIKEEEVFQRMKQLEPFRLFSHHDADGVYGAVLLSKAFEIGTVEFPDTFGDYGDDANVSIDFGSPLSAVEWGGIAIDHHPHDMKDRKYALIKDNVPAGGIVYNVFKTKIAPEFSWLAAGSYVGDGQAPMIPPEVFEKHPALLEGRASIYQSYGKTSIYEYSLYSLLSSPVNAVCRIGRAYQAYQILKTCKTPDDVITNSIFAEAQNLLNAEFERIIMQFGKDKKTKRSASVIGKFMVMPFESSYKIASRVATSIGTSTRDKTVICINEKLGEISIRGDLAYWLLMKMKPLGWKMGGHAGYMGGSMQEGQDVRKFLSDLRSVV